MKTNYTKGPWVEHRVCSGLHQIFPANHESNTVAIAVLSHENDTDYPTREVTTPANAQLIAAAPELLEALQMIVECFPKNVIEDQCGEDYHKVFDAIKKATGK